MHSFLPFKHSRLRVYMPLFAALLLVLTPGMGAADPAPASPVPEVSTATPSVVQEALQAVVEQTAPETPAAPVVQTASALPAVSGEPGSALAKEGASVPLQAEWLLDPKGTHTLTDVLSPNAQKEFKPYEPESPPSGGGPSDALEVEGKAPAFPLVLDLNTRIAGQLPGIPQVWLVRPGESNGTPVRPSSDGLYSLPSPLPDQTGIYIRVNGILAPGFAPMLRNAGEPDPRGRTRDAAAACAAGRAVVPVPPARGHRAPPIFPQAPARERVRAFFIPVAPAQTTPTGLAPNATRRA